MLGTHEVGELGLPLQAKLLTSIEHGRIRRLGAESTTAVDTRIIAATGIDLEAAVRASRFRLDLYHRLLVLSFHLPPLRERGSDVVLLARHFVCTAAARHSRRVGDLHASTIRLLQNHPWPGNIRQLAHAMEAAVLLADGDSIRPADLPPRIMQLTAEVSAPASRYSFYGTRAEERQRIMDMLRAQHGNLTRSARMLGMSRNTLRARIAELDIRPPRGAVTGPGAADPH